MKFFVLNFVLDILISLNVVTLQVVYTLSNSCLVYTLQADVKFLKKINFHRILFFHAFAFHIPSNPVYKQRLIIGSKVTFF